MRVLELGRFNQQSFLGLSSVARFYEFSFGVLAHEIVNKIIMRNCISDFEVAHHYREHFCEHRHYV